MTSRFFRMARNTAGILGGITIGSLVLIPDTVERLTRTTRVLSTCGSVAADDYLSRKLKSFRDEKFTPKDQLELDTRNAKKFLHLAEKNGFLFCKLGQYAAAHPQVPPSYKLVLKTLQDKAPPHTWEDVETVLREEFPGTLESKFAAIERQPIASASIAQVHRGWLLDGTQVAVKVQHRELKRMARSDVAALDSVFLALHYFYKDLEYLRDAWVRWRVTLLDELDFKREAENGERVRAHFQHDPRFHVPLIHSGNSTHRVLTQEWIHGETLRDLIDKATVAVDPAAPPPPTSFTTGSEGSSSKHPPLLVAPFAKYGVVNPSDVGRATCDFFAEQLLLHGFVHCDPHPANVMLRRRPPSASLATTLPEWQLCVIDWGMVRQLDVPFRASFCDLWFHLLTQNKEGAMQATRGMGMLEEDTEALSYFLTFRGVGKGSGKLGAPKTKEEWKAVRKQYEWVTASDVNAFALRLPSDFSFVMRTISLARGLNEVLGGNNRDRFASFGSAAAAGRRVSERGGGRENMGGGGGGAVRDTLTPPTLASSLWTAFQAVAVEEEVGVNPLAPRVLTDSERQESKSWWEKQGRGVRKWVDDWVMALLLVLIDLRETWGANK